MGLGLLSAQAGFGRDSGNRPQPIETLDGLTLAQIDEFFAFGSNFQQGMFVG